MIADGDASPEAGKEFKTTQGFNRTQRTWLIKEVISQQVTEGTKVNGHIIGDGWIEFICKAELVE